MLSPISSRWAPAAILLVLLAASAQAAETMPPAQEARYNELCDKLIAPCCWAESIRVHRSGLALEMRAEVASMVSAGKSDADILATFVERHGERVLMLPEGGKRQWLFIIPVVMLLLGGLILAFVLRRMKARPVAAAAAGPAIDVKDSDLEW